MQDIYREACEQCILKGHISEPVRISGVEIRYIDCQRDNENAKKHFLRTLDREDAFLWVLQSINLLHCLYLNEEFVMRKSF